VAFYSKKKEEATEETAEEENPSIFFLPQQQTSEMRMTGVYGEISEEKCSELIYHMYSLLASGKVEDEEGNVTCNPFEFVVSTWGGSAAEMFAVYDVMRMIKDECDIGTLGLGKVMSAGVLLLAAGTKGKRRIGKSCRVMIHNAASGHVGELHNLETELEELKETQKRYIDALVKNSDMTKKYLKNLLDRKTNVYLTAQEAVELGIADEVV